LTPGQVKGSSGDGLPEAVDEQSGVDAGFAFAVRDDDINLRQ